MPHRGGWLYEGSHRVKFFFESFREFKRGFQNGIKNLILKNKISNRPRGGWIYELDHKVERMEVVYWVIQWADFYPALP
jgi:hypothetical protein